VILVGISGLARKLMVFARSGRGGGGEGVGRARWGIIIAVVIPAVFFGLAHASNENATWLSTFNIVIFGLLFGTGYVLTGELALPIGLHFGWNFVQGFVFGVVAPGKNTGRCSSSPMTRRRRSGPASLMGPRAGSWGRPPSLPASWQHSRGRDLSTAQPCWSPLSTPAADFTRRRFGLLTCTVADSRQPLNRTGAPSGVDMASKRSDNVCPCVLAPSAAVHIMHAMHRRPPLPPTCRGSGAAFATRRSGVQVPLAPLK
jgi:hypothetical protein